MWKRKRNRNRGYWGRYWMLWMHMQIPGWARPTMILITLITSPSTNPDSEKSTESATSFELTVPKSPLMRINTEHQIPNTNYTIPNTKYRVTKQRHYRFIIIIILHCTRTEARGDQPVTHESVRTDEQPAMIHQRSGLPRRARSSPDLMAFNTTMWSNHSRHERRVHGT